MMEQSKYSPESSKQEKPKEIYLEIGPGLDPSAVRGARSFEGDKIYIGIDSAKGDYNNQKGQEYGAAVARQTAEMQNKVKAERPDENIHFVFGEGVQLPLNDQSVREIYMANVLTAPQIPLLRAKLLSEAGRVLEPEGDLIVKVSWDTWLWPKDEVAQMLRDAGFEPGAPISAEENPVEFEQLERFYGNTEGVDMPVGYFYFARKAGT